MRFVYFNILLVEDKKKIIAMVCDTIVSETENNAI